MVPLDKLVQGTQQIADKDFSNRLTLDSEDEFSDLAEAMNTMADRLGRQFGALNTLAQIDQLILSSESLEQVIELEREISVVLARGQNGACHCFPPAENQHRNGILDVSTVPARISSDLEKQAQQSAIKIADGLDYCGVLAVEFFISTDDELLVNEIAPRPHNSGHYTLDACYTSQFEQQVRMICGLKAGNCELHTPVTMLNILGDIWPQSGEPAWDEVLNMERTRLHLYGKKEARRGRKMGHINFLAKDADQLQQLVDQGRAILHI